MAVTSLAFAPNGKVIASGSADNTIGLWDTATGRPLSVLRGHSNAVSFVGYASATRLISAAFNESTVGVWNPLTGELLDTIDCRLVAIKAVAASGSGSLLAIADSRTIRLWDLVANHPQEILWPESPSVAIAISPHAGIIAVASVKGGLTLWSRAGVKVSTLIDEGPATCRYVAFSPDGNSLAAIDTNKTLHLYDVVFPREREKLREVDCMTYAPDSRTMIVSFLNGSTMRVDSATLRTMGQPLQTGKAGVIAYAPDATTVAIAVGSSISIWDSARGRLLASINPGPRPPGGGVLVDFMRPHNSIESLPHDEESQRKLMYVDDEGRPWSGYEITVATKLGHEFEFGVDWDMLQW
jgi:WD40 repeat protein